MIRQTPGLFLSLLLTQRLHNFPFEFRQALVNGGYRIGGHCVDISGWASRSNRSF